MILLSLRNHARIQLAVLDYNLAKNKDGNYIYHHKYQKASKKWDATATLESKKYQYIPPLLKAIHEERSFIIACNQKHPTSSWLLSY